MSQNSLFPKKILDCLKRPGGSQDDIMEIVEGGLKCANTGEFFANERSVPFLFKETDGDRKHITDTIKNFYEENPFPSYEGLEDFGNLVNKGSSNSFSNELLQSIGFNKLILECGCGTGQLTNFLQLNNNYTLGIDLSLSSLSLAIEHKTRNELSRSSFAQMNIFNMAIKDEVFDVVISHGVLHHTFNAKRAFSHIIQKLKPGGIVVIGLYNRYARIMTWLRSKLIPVFGPNIDYVIRNKAIDPKKREIWIADQYYNPHETWHSIGEVIGWFDENNIEYINCSPPILGSHTNTGPNGMFTASDPAGSYERLITQLGWIGSISREGALFDVIGRKAS